MIELEGIILAAGKGTRLLPITEKFPKCLVPIGNTMLLEYHLETLKSLSIKKCFIVVGHYGFEIAKLLGAGDKYGIQIEYVEQNEPLGIANALSVVTNLVTKPFLLILGDIFFRTKDLKTMVDIFQHKKANGVLATKEEPEPSAIKRNFSIDFDDTGLVRTVVEKPKKLKNNIKGCGMYLFDDNIFEAVNRTPRTALRNEYEITDSIQIFIDLGYKVYYANVIEADLNITYPYDLLNINLEILNIHNKDRIVGTQVSIGKNVELENAVIGENAIIADNVRLKNVVIFPDTQIREGRRIENSIVTRTHITRI